MIRDGRNYWIHYAGKQLMYTLSLADIIFERIIHFQLPSLEIDERLSWSDLPVIDVFVTNNFFFMNKFAFDYVHQIRFLYFWVKLVEGWAAMWKGKKKKKLNINKQKNAETSCRISNFSIFFLANNTLQFGGELCHKFCLFLTHWLWDTSFPSSGRRCVG